MADTLTAQDARYDKMFKVEKERANDGVDLERDYSLDLCALRDQAPVMKGSPRQLLGLPEVQDGYLKDREQWTLLSFAACDKGFRDAEAFSNTIHLESRGMSAIGPTILQMDGKEHKAYRATAQPLFLRPRVLDWWKRRWIDETVDTLLDRLQGERAVDLNMELCARLPMYVVTRSIGLDGMDALHFREHLTRSTFGAHMVTPEEAAKSRDEVNRIMLDLIDARRKTPGDDVITGLLANQLDLPDGTSRALTNEEMFSYCKLMIFAGGGTTWRQLGITIDALLSHRHFWDECLANRALIEPAIDEALRWRPTDPYFPRLSTRDVEVDGVVVPAGVRVQICLGAGNRDPKIYDRPDEYNIHRPKQYHMGLGLGPHRCLGMDVAKQEMVAAINGLMDRWPNMDFDPDQPRPKFRGLDHCGMSAVTVVLQ